MLEASTENSRDEEGKERAFILAKVAWGALPGKQLLDLGAKEQAPLPIKEVEREEFVIT